ncbi:MAG: hypothetical protein ACR2QH_01090, partial [Geminicoccaceae bacterium]
MTNWETWIKRYIWDDERTPYLVAPERMTRRQAEYELFAYCVFLSCFFIVAALATASLPTATFYTLSIPVAAVLLGFTKHVSAAAYCATAPIAAALYLALGGFPDDLGTIDYVVIITLIILWAAYSFRIISIAKGYEQMPSA